jgi:hypothetical protein
MPPMRTFYLDLCCLNRPFDDQHQPRVRLEAEAVLGLIQLARLGELGWIGSDVLDRAQREASKLAVRVENPAKWYPEAIAP